MKKDIYNCPAREVTPDMVIEEAETLSKDPLNKDKIVGLLKAFGWLLNKTQRAQIISAGAIAEAKWMEEHWKELKERNEKIYKENIAIESGYRDDLPATHPHNIKVSTAAMANNAQVENLVSAYEEAKKVLEKNPDAFTYNLNHRTQDGKVRINMNQKQVRIITENGNIFRVDVEEELKRHRREADYDTGIDLKKKSSNNSKTNSGKTKEVNDYIGDNEFREDDDD